MPIIFGTNRDQIQLASLEMYISEENPVRLIDAFIDTLNLDKLGFVVKGKSKQGRPAYAPAILLRVYLYGYLNRIRSSRELEKACRRNVEMWWLLKSQMPCYKTISEFRRINHSLFKLVFREWNMLCKEWDLFGGETIAVDGSKFRAQNSKKNNFNKKKIERHLEYIDKKTEEYLAELEEGDKEDDGVFMEENIKKKLKELKKRKARYESLKEKLEDLKESGETQISLTDEDARSLPLHKNVVEVGYNIQTATDAKNKMIVSFDVLNKKDDHALAPMSKMAKDFLGVEGINVLADKGYHTGLQFKECAENNISTFVSVRKNNNSGNKDTNYRKDKFRYDEEKDCYICPQKEELTTKGVWYTKKGRIESKNYKFQRYEAPLETCRNCPARELCGPFGRSRGRYIERTEFDKYVEANKLRVESNKAYYRQRQSIVEHPFGTIKRQWGYSYTLLQTIPKVEADFSLIFLTYNIKRAITIIGIRELIELLKKVKGGLSLLKGLVLSGCKAFFDQLNIGNKIRNKNKNVVAGW